MNIKKTDLIAFKDGVYLTHYKYIFNNHVAYFDLYENKDDISLNICNLEESKKMFTKYIHQSEHENIDKAIIKAEEVLLGIY